MKSTHPKTKRPKSDTSWARKMLDQVVPFDRWLLQRSRTAYEIEMYHKIVDELHRMADDKRSAET